MIVLLYGPDNYRSRQKLNEIIDYYKKIHKSGLNLKFFDEKTADFKDFQNEIKSVSMFAEKKLIVLEGVFANQDFKENFLKTSKNFIDSKDIILFYEKKEISKTDPLFKILKKSAKSQEFELLDGQRLKNWIKKEIENYGAKISENALKLLIDFVGNNLWQIANEIKKLVSFKSGNIIGEKDIELLVKPKIETDIFETIDAIASKNKRRALKFIKTHLEKGDSPHYLFSMINFQFRNLLIIKSCELRRQLYANNMRILTTKLRMHPYVVRKTLWQAKKFSFDELKKIYQKIFQIDLAIKKGKIEPETALDLLLTEI